MRRASEIIVPLFGVINLCTLAPGHIIQILVSGLAMEVGSRISGLVSWEVVLSYTVRITDLYKNCRLQCGERKKLSSRRRLLK